MRKSPKSQNLKSTKNGEPYLRDVRYLVLPDVELLEVLTEADILQGADAVHTKIIEYTVTILQNDTHSPFFFPALPPLPQLKTNIMHF